MKNLSWIALSTLLWAPQLHAQAAPAAPAAPTAKPAPAAPAAAPAAKPAAAPAAPAAAPAAPTAKPAPGATAAASTDKSVEWVYDPAHSHIGFVARHLGFSKVEGQFKKSAATIKADPKTAKITSLEATAEAASIDTGIEKRDTHLRAEDFFAADKYPQLKLVLKSIKFNGNKFTANADVTIRDVTKSVPFKGELLGVHPANFGQGQHLRAGYEATATINRKDFGLSWSMVTEGIAVVADNVQLDLGIEISYTPPAPTAATPAATGATGAVASAPAAAAGKAPAAPAAQPAAASKAPAAPPSAAKAPAPAAAQPAAASKAPAAAPAAKP